jgi:hypothetical protein
LGALWVFLPVSVERGCGSPDAFVCTYGQGKNESDRTSQTCHRLEIRMRTRMRAQGFSDIHFCQLSRFLACAM